MPPKARLRNGDFISADWRAVLLRDPCVYCGRSPTGLDHIRPRAAGGTDGWENRAPACGDCDGAKAHHSLLSFLAGYPIVARKSRVVRAIRSAQRISLRLARERARYAVATQFYNGNIRLPEECSSWVSRIQTDPTDVGAAVPVEACGSNISI